MSIKKEKEQKPKKPKYVRICPKCGSLDVEILNITKQYTFAFGLPTAYKCRSCGFSSYIFPEIDSNKIQDIDKVSNKDNPDKARDTK